MIVVFSPGGAADILARVVGAQMRHGRGQQVIVHNRPGARGIIASEITTKATLDGYTLMYVAIGHPINSPIYRKLPPEILKAAAAEAVRAVSTKEQRERIALMGGEVVASSPAEFDAFLRAEIERYRPVTKAAGITAD